MLAIANMFETLFDRTESFDVSTFVDEHNKYIRYVVPGFSEKDLKVSVAGDSIKISAKVEKEENKNNLFKVENSNFTHQYRLPRDIVKEEVSAEYKSGVLLIRLPKMNRAPPAEPKDIQVKLLE